MFDIHIITVYKVKEGLYVPKVEVKRQRMEVKVRPRREEISRMMNFEVRVKFKEVESKKA
jgi:hypothetical protein